MSHQRFHWLEKLQVQLASAAAFGVVYFWLWRLLRPWDPEASLAFIPYGNAHQLLVLAGVVWALAAAAALVTTRSRPEGAMAAVLIGTAGFSLRSAPIRTLLWLQDDNFRGLFSRLLAETVLLAGVLIGSAVIIVIVRRIIRAARPGWVWQDPLANISEAERSAADKAKSDQTGAKLAMEPGPVNWIVIRGGRQYGRKLTGAQYAAQGLLCLAIMLAITVVLVLVLLRTSDRGQIVFALLAANFLAMLVAHQVFPSPYSMVAWLAPMLIGMLFYALAAVSAINSGVNAWSQVSPYAGVLPIDWMTAGAGGGVLGHWVSERIHELRHFEKHEKGQ